MHDPRPQTLQALTPKAHLRACCCSCCYYYYYYYYYYCYYCYYYCYYSYYYYYYYYYYHHLVYHCDYDYEHDCDHDDHQCFDYVRLLLLLLFVQLLQQRPCPSDIVAAKWLEWDSGSES